jgi:hypothetical protein
VTSSTPLNTFNPILLDFAVCMWNRNSTNEITSQLSSRIANVTDLFSVFRRSYKHYMNRKVYPYIKLPGPVEIDETKIGIQRWHWKGGYPKDVRWAFGIYCRKTHLKIVYEIKTKQSNELISVIKEHVPVGSIVFSD